MSDFSEAQTSNVNGGNTSCGSNHESGVNLMKDLSSMYFLSVTSVPDSVFTDSDIKLEFEKLFTSYSSDIRFIYLKSFRRVRLILTSEEMSKRVRHEMHPTDFRGEEMGVYTVKPILRRNSDPNLKPPPLTKQFLISPPASPPFGWEANTNEATPVINYDLLAAIASLDTSEPFLLHSGTVEVPSIVVHLSEEGGDGDEFHPLKSLPREMVQTKFPPTK